MAEDVCWDMISVQQVAEILKQGTGKRLIIDSRSFLEFNTCHITESINVSSSKLIKRRLQQNKLLVRDLLTRSCQLDIDISYEVIVYDQCTTNCSTLSTDCFLLVLVNKLCEVFKGVSLLKGGFVEFQATHPSLCETQMCCTSSGSYKCPPMTSMSQPCMPVSNVGPTKILPFLFLGSQQDALSQETLKQNGITYIVNVSTTSPRPEEIQEGHFLRIPINDSYCDKLLPHFQMAFQFIDKVREGNGCALVHCLAGISRSPTLAIAYVMRYLNISTDEAYKYVKDKRPTISPNFNFLGQLEEYEKQLCSSSHLVLSPVIEELRIVKKKCDLDVMRPLSPTVVTPRQRISHKNCVPSSLHSPTITLAKFNFNQPSPVIEETSVESHGGDIAQRTTVDIGSDMTFKHLPTTSLGQLSFTPCFARVEPTLSVSQLEFCRSTADNQTPFVRCSGSVKRPHDVPVFYDQYKDHQIFQVSSRFATRDTQSRQMKTKRYFVRPNIIAFSSHSVVDRNCVDSSLPNKCLVKQNFKTPKKKKVPTATLR